MSVWGGVYDEVWLKVSEREDVTVHASVLVAVRVAVPVGVWVAGEAVRVTLCVGRTVTDGEAVAVAVREPLQVSTALALAVALRVTEVEADTDAVTETLPEPEATGVVVWVVVKDRVSVQRRDADGVSLPVASGDSE